MGHPRNSTRQEGYSMKLAFIAAAVIAMTTGCATITRGTQDTISVTSTPANADVQLSNGQRSKTPATFKLPRNRPVRVEISKEGYESQSVQVLPQVSGGGAAGMAGNVIVGGVVGVGVDAVSGAMYDLTPDTIHVTLDLDQ